MCQNKKKSSSQPTSSRKEGEVEEPCPHRPGTITVQVYDGNTYDEIPKAKVTLSGPTPGDKTTDSEGFATFEKADPGPNYQVEVSLKAIKEYESAELRPKPSSVSFTLPAGGNKDLNFGVYPPANLKVKVVFEDTDSEGKEVVTILDGVSIKSDGSDSAEPRKGTTAAKEKGGWASFEKIPSGQYTISTSSLGKYEGEYQLINASSKVTLESGKTKEVVLEAEPSGWIDLHFVKAGTAPEEDIPGLTVTVKLAGGKTVSKTSLHDGIAKFEKLKKGNVAIEEVSSTDDVWEFVEIKA